MCLELSSVKRRLTLWVVFHSKSAIAMVQSGTAGVYNRSIRLLDQGLKGSRVGSRLVKERPSYQGRSGMCVTKCHLDFSTCRWQTKTVPRFPFVIRNSLSK